MKTKWLMENHLRMDAQMWANLNLKVSVLDVDLAEQDLVMLAQYESLPYQKVNPVLLAKKIGQNPMMPDDIVPSYVFVLESLQLEQADGTQAEGEGDDDQVKIEADVTISNSQREEDSQNAKKAAEAKGKEKPKEPAKKLTAAEQKKLQEEEEAKRKRDEETANKKAMDTTASQALRKQ